MKKILCLDGGGFKARFSFDMMMHLAYNSSEPLISVFDVIFGVSSGAWIGALIALNKFPNPQLGLELFGQTNEAFRNKNDFGPLAEPKYDGVGKRALLHRVFKDIRLGDIKLTHFCVLCCTATGKPRLFRTWDPDDQNVFLADILHATSSIPVLFPPVLLKGQYLVDGGCISNQVLNLAFLETDLLFPRTQLRMLSVGTQSIAELKEDTEFMERLGLMGWIALGLFDILTGVADDTEIRMMKRVLGIDNFRRIECDKCSSLRFDDMSLEAEASIRQSVTDVWSNHGSSLLQFLNI